MILTEQYSALVGGELLGAAEAGTDKLVGDLTAAGNGAWRGVVTATTDRTIETIVMDTHCKTALKGTQQVEVVATRGTYAEGRNLLLSLTPVSPPSYATYPECDQPPLKTKAPNGIEWLYFYFEDYRGGGIEVKLPDKPGGTWTWELAPNPNPGLRGGCSDLPVLLCEHMTTLTVEYR